MRDYKNICVITNIGTHYRLPIYTKMAEELPCDFYLGDHVETPIKTFEYHQLKGFQKTLRNFLVTIIKNNFVGKITDGKNSYNV